MAADRSPGVAGEGSGHSAEGPAEPAATAVVAPGSATLDTALSTVLGGRTAQALGKALGVRTVADLLSTYPRRYVKRGELTALSELPVGEQVTLVAEVLKVSERSMRQRRGTILEVSISDGKGIASLTFFNQAWRQRDLRPGARGIFAGKVSDYRGTIQLAHPDYELFDDDHPPIGDETSPEAKRWAEMPIPIYPATSTVASWQVAASVALALDAIGAVPDPVPDAVRAERRLMPFVRALDAIHRPRRDGEQWAGRTALAFQEAFVLQATLLQRRAEHASHAATPRMPQPGGLLERFDQALPFELTGDQRAVGRDIQAELAKPQPMNRLVQGEVGSGKTLVALRAMLAVADSGGQSALLAPTEVLAAQHLRSITRALGPDLAARLMPTLVTGQLPVSERKRALLRVVTGQAGIVIGTHALLSDTTQFFDLGLVVVDEQHRFGVEQRDVLRRKGQDPHVLVLTATPIPRTVAMTVFGDLDVSTIAELPAGRAGIQSFTAPLSDHPSWEARVWERTAEEIAQGRQAFVVCPAISPRQAEEADDLDGEAPTAGAPLASVEEVAQLLARHPRLGGVRRAVLHGRMSAEEKDETMRAFAAHEIDLLVATTVIEVGVDVPNASTMVVLDADRFGISQLHQLRGRIGRGGVPGIALFVTRALPETLARERVDAVAATTDGFALAEVDLDLRREGDVLGRRQSGGRSSLRLLTVARDGDVIQDARVAAAEIVGQDAALGGHPALAEAIRRRLDDEERDFLDKN